MEQWQDVASQQLKLLTNNLNELLTKGLGLLRSELGVDLGLKPELIPPWVILLAVCSGLVLMVALWASVCLAIFKKQPALSPEDDGIEVKLGAVKPVKSEEPKKKRKRTERKTQSNGRAVAEAQEEVLQAEETVPHQQSPPSEVKIEKVAEGKKSKKKAKQAGKETKTVTADRKEPEEGTWETKVSNKEKREQRKKDKGSSDGSASPGGGNTPVSSPPEQPKASAGPPPVSQKKKKGESTKAKPEKVEVVAPQVNSEVAAVTAGATAVTVKVPARTIHKKTDTWKASREPASLLCGDIDESWTMVEKGMTTSQSGLSAEPVRERPWLSQPKLDDEWSGLNGGSVDPTSDWNAPSEVWGNYEEPTPAPPPSQEQPLPEPTKVNLLIGEADDDEEEKDKGEGSADGVAKAKKKKKKKKKVAEEAAGQVEEPRKEVIPVVSMKKQPPRQESSAAVQPIKVALVETRVEQPVKEITSQKPLVTQVPLKPTDEKPEESQAPKPAKKKKARRET